jgi:hypothetical protein
VFAGIVDTGSSDKILAILHAKFQILKAPSCTLVNSRGNPKADGLGDYSEDVFGERGYMVAEKIVESPILSGRSQTILPSDRLKNFLCSPA